MDENVPGKQKSGRDAHFSQKGFLNSDKIISYSDSLSNVSESCKVAVRKVQNMAFIRRDILW